ncbi:hypothetical protein SDC9_162939 [bioreactor metagenome]|uniref:Uncharacterized protein n=1 Tax=bioreactor metagenome TaxID=1076179 RepID=A0A645FMG3_9ZZZZ
MQYSLRHAFLLHHAAADADEHAGPALFYLFEPGDVAQGLALRVVTDAAGVEQHQVGLLTVFGLHKAHMAQRARQGF